MTIAPVTMKAIPYDALADLQPITQVGAVPFFLVVNPGVPADTLAEFIAHAKANAGKLNYSVLRQQHLEPPRRRVVQGRSPGPRRVHVPYKGSGPSITDLLAGRCSTASTRRRPVLEHVRAGKLRALAVVGAPAAAPVRRRFRRSRKPGLPDFSRGTWSGLFAPAKTPRAVVDRMHEEVAALLGSPEIVKAFSDRGIVPSAVTPDAFRRFMPVRDRAMEGRSPPRSGIVAE